MKKLISILLICMLLCPLAPERVCAASDEDTNTSSASDLTASIPADWPAAPAVNSEAAIVIERSTGTILYAKNALQTMYPASTTKLMTALLTLEDGSLSDIVKFSSKAVYSLESGASHIGMKPGEQMSVKDCMYGLLLPSANEVANALAEYVSGSMNDFTARMNEKATELNCINTNFENPNGLHHENHYSCAYDMALIMLECLKSETFLEIDSAPTYVRPADALLPKEIPMATTHIMMRSGSEYYTAEVKGGKTGWTKQSGSCLVTYGVKDGMEVVCATMNAADPGQYKDTQLLLNYAFNNFKLLRASEQDTEFGTTQLSFESPLQLTSQIKVLKELDNQSQVILPKDASFEMLERESSTDAVTYLYQGYPVGNAALLDTASQNLADLYQKKAPALSPIPFMPLKTQNILIYAGGAVCVLLLAAIIFFAFRSRDVAARRKKKSKKHLKRLRF